MASTTSLCLRDRISGPSNPRAAPKREKNMAVPKWNDFIDPVMRLLADGEPRTRSEILAGVVEAIKLTAEDMADSLPSGEPRYIGRVGWAITDSFQAGYL